MAWWLWCFFLCYSGCVLCPVVLSGVNLKRFNGFFVLVGFFDRGRGCGLCGGFFPLSGVSAGSGVCRFWWVVVAIVSGCRIGYS